MKIALFASLVLVAGCSQNPLAPTPLVSPSVVTSMQPGPVLPSTVPLLPVPAPTVEPVPVLTIPVVVPIPVAEERPSGPCGASPCADPPHPAVGPCGPVPCVDPPVVSACGLVACLPCEGPGCALMTGKP